MRGAHLGPLEISRICSAPNLEPAWDPLGIPLGSPWTPWDPWTVLGTPLGCPALILRQHLEAQAQLHKLRKGKQVEARCEALMR